MRLIHANQRTGGDHGLDTKSRAVIERAPASVLNEAMQPPIDYRTFQTLNSFSFRLRSDRKAPKTAASSLYGLEYRRSRPVPSPEAPIIPWPLLELDAGEGFLKNITILCKRACIIYSQLMS